MNRTEQSYRKKVIVEQEAQLLLRWRSVRCSGSFKVFNFDTNGKCICDFMLVNNTMSHSVLHCSACSYHTVLIKLLPSTGGGVLFNTLVFNDLCEYRNNSVLPKTTFFSLHFCHMQYGSSFNHFDIHVVGFKMWHIESNNAK